MANNSLTRYRGYLYIVDDGKFKLLRNPLVSFDTVDALMEYIDNIYKGNICRICKKPVDMSTDGVISIHSFTKDSVQRDVLLCQSCMDLITFHIFNKLDGKFKMGDLKFFKKDCP